MSNHKNVISTFFSVDAWDDFITIRCSDVTVSLEVTEEYKKLEEEFEALSKKARSACGDNALINDLLDAHLNMSASTNICANCWKDGFLFGVALGAKASGVLNEFDI